jgi:fluoroquinolone resistance protein
MKEVLQQEKTFSNKNFSEKKITGREFDRCIFTNCDFSSCSISQSDFIDCLFDNCNFSMANLNHSGLKNCDFINSKLVGMDFSVCNDFLFSVNFKNCQLDYSTFFQKKMKKTKFIECSLKEVDFSEVELTESIFMTCDLLGAVFENTILVKADLRGALNYNIDPEQNKIKKAKFAYPGLIGLLDKYEIIIE